MNWYVLVFPAVAVAAHALFRRFVPPDQLIEGHEVAGFLVSVVGVLYSVVLGFLVGTVWTGFTAAQQALDLEAGYVADAFNFAGQVREPERHELQRVLARYAIEVRSNEGSFLERGRQDPRALALVEEAVKITMAMPPPAATDSAGAVLAATATRTALLENLRSIGDTRRLRLVQSQSHLPRVMFASLILGAVFVLAFAFFFGVRSFYKQMAMTALVAASIGLFFGLVVELNTPYSGFISVSHDAWRYVIENNRLETFAR